MVDPIQSTQVVHARVGDDHIVGVKALHVLLLKDGGGWFAQGLEIDYGVSGESEEDVKKRFGIGLKMTIKEHLLMYNNIEKLLRIAPQDVWKPYLEASPTSLKAYSTIQKHEIESGADESIWPFDEIRFVQPQDGRRERHTA